MNPSITRIQLPLLVAATVLLYCSIVNAQDYQVVDLGAIYPGTGSSGFAVNNSGQVVGQSAADELSAQLHAFLWQGGVMTDLQTLAPNAHSTATAINSVGQVTGVSYDL